MGWLARLLGKKPGFEAWWEITGPTFSEQRMSEVIRDLSERLQRHQATKGEQILVVLYLASTIVTGMFEDGLKQKARSFISAVPELLRGLDPPVEVTEFSRMLSERAEGWTSGTRQSPESVGVWRRDIDEGKVSAMTDEHMNAFRGKKLRVFLPDYTGALAWMIAQQVHQLWQEGSRDEAVDVYETLTTLIESNLEREGKLDLFE